MAHPVTHNETPPPPHPKCATYSTMTQGGCKERLRGIISVHRAAFFTFSVQAVHFTLQRQQQALHRIPPTADSKSDPPHPPEEQEMRKTAKASFVASPIFHPTLILTARKIVVKKNKKKERNHPTRIKKKKKIN